MVAIAEVVVEAVLCQALTGLNNFFVLNLGRCPRLECLALSGQRMGGTQDRP